jgi:hypothetical protein
MFFALWYPSPALPPVMMTVLSCMVCSFLP